MPEYEYFFGRKCTEAVLSNSNITRKLLLFEITEVLTAVFKKQIYCVVYNNFRHAVVPFYHQISEYCTSIMGLLTLLSRHFRVPNVTVISNGGVNMA